MSSLPSPTLPLLAAEVCTYEGLWLDTQSTHVYGFVAVHVHTYGSVQGVHTQQSEAFPSAGACTNVWVCLYGSVGLSEVGQHSHSPTGEAKAAAGTPLEAPLWKQGLPSTGLSAPLCSLPRQGFCLTLCSAQAFM